jgi:hypothetical protein
MNQGRGLERLSRLLLNQLLCREFAQFVIDQRQELSGGVRVAGFDAGEDLRDFVHERHHGAAWTLVRV